MADNQAQGKNPLKTTWGSRLPNITRQYILHKYIAVHTTKLVQLVASCIHSNGNHKSKWETIHTTYRALIRKGRKMNYYWRYYSLIQLFVIFEKSLFSEHPLRTPNEGPATYIPLTTLHLFLPLESTLLSLVIPCPSPPQGTVPENLQAHVAMRQAIYSMYVVLSTADRIEYKYARKQPQGQG